MVLVGEGVLVVKRWLGWLFKYNVGGVVRFVVSGMGRFRGWFKKSGLGLVLRFVGKWLCGCLLKFGGFVGVVGMVLVKCCGRLLKGSGILKVWKLLG